MLSTVEFMKNIIALVFMLSFSLPMMAITPAEQLLNLLIVGVQ